MKIDNRISAAVIITTLLVVAYIFYYQSQPLDESALEQRNNAAFNLEKAGQSESLKNLVAKPGGIYKENLPQNHLSEEAKQLVGRYMVRLECEDPIVSCESGSVDYIVTLLDSGYARRTIVHLGNVSAINERQYLKNIWVYNDERKEIVVYLEEGAKFFLDVNKAQNLVMNVEKTLAESPDNQAFFAKNTVPLRAYELKRDRTNDVKNTK